MYLRANIPLILNYLQALKDATIPESISYYAVHLLELAVTVPNPGSHKMVGCHLFAIAFIMKVRGNHACMSVYT